MKTAIVLVLAAALAGAGYSETAAPTPQQTAKARRDAIFAQVPDVAGLPRVLLLGDSISMGYTLKVRELLQGKASVHRPAENCFDTATGLHKIDAWLGDKKWDVIHFNFGLHDNNYKDAAGKLTSPDQGQLTATPEQYAKNLSLLVARLKQTGAILIFATTTPIPPDSIGRRAGAETAYNEVARKIMKEVGIAINDLHAVVIDQHVLRLAPNNVHYQDSGYDTLAQVVAGKIQAALPARP